MAFMMKKKKYKFQVEVCLEELVEVPFVSAVLFAKVRLLEGGNFQDHSTREEVKGHTVKWNARFEFPCKMTANASTCVLEPCILRISVRKEIKGGRSFQKLGFCDLNLAELAGSGQVSRRYLLEGYDTRHRQDNSMLKVTIKMNMLAGDILFKNPSPTMKETVDVAAPTEVDTIVAPEGRTPDSGGSLAGSVASGSSGFGSLPKKRPALFSSDLLANQLPSSLPNDVAEVPISEIETEVIPATPNVLATGAPTVVEIPGHSRNSSTTSQMSRASGYSTQHSRQSSSGDSGHIRSPSWPVWAPTLLTPPFSPPSPSVHITDPLRQKFWSFGFQQKKSLKIEMNGQHNEDEEFSTPKGCILFQPNYISNEHVINIVNNDSSLSNDSTIYGTPRGNVLYDRQLSNHSNSSAEVFSTPNGTIENRVDVPGENINQITYPVDLKKSFSCTVVEQKLLSMSTIRENESIELRKGLVRSKTEGDANDFIIPRKSALENEYLMKNNNKFFNFTQKSENIIHNLLTPLSKRRAKSASETNGYVGKHSTPVSDKNNSELFKVPGSPILRNPNKNSPSKLSPISSHRATSLGSLRSSPLAGNQRAARATLQQNCRNLSSGSLALSETGSLDRCKTAAERRKRAQEITEVGGPVSGRVEGTRVNTDNLIDELLKATNLDQADEAAETTGLQLFIKNDGTAALGNHEVKSQISSGVQTFKQVVIDTSEKR